VSKDRPIIFSAPMVRALLEGRKTMTRRVLKPCVDIPQAICWVPETAAGVSFAREGWWTAQIGERTYTGAARVGYELGQRLWVRESWQTGSTCNGPQISFRATPDFFEINAWDGPDEGCGPSFNYDRCPGSRFYEWLPDVLSRDGPWRSPIHMPRWASRLTLIIHAVRVERLQDISEDDALREGIRRVHHGDGEYYYHYERDDPDPKNWVHADYAYHELWEQLHGSDSWSANPWVAAISFRVIRANIDSAEARAA